MAEKIITYFISRNCFAMDIIGNYLGNFNSRITGLWSLEWFRNIYLFESDEIGPDLVIRVGKMAVAL